MLQAQQELIVELVLLQELCQGQGMFRAPHRAPLGAQCGDIRHPRRQEFARRTSRKGPCDCQGLGGLARDRSQLLLGVTGRCVPRAEGQGRPDTLEDLAVARGRVRGFQETGQNPSQAGVVFGDLPAVLRVVMGSPPELSAVVVGHQDGCR